VPELGDPAQAAAQLRFGVHQVDGLHPALAEDLRALHAGRARADDEHALLSVGGLVELLGVPAAAVLLAGGGVLRADHRRAADLPPRDALVAADALADVLEAALLDLLGEEGVGDRRPGGADDVELPGLDDPHHRVGVRDAPDADDRLVRVVAGLHLARVGLLVVLLEEARRPGVLPPLGDVAHGEVPQVHEVVDVLDEAHAVLADLDRGLAVQGVDREARGDRAVVADRLADPLEALLPEACAVLEGAAVLVRALVVVGREELQRQVGVRAVDVDDVEAGLAGADGGIDVVALDERDVVAVHVARVGVDLEVRGDLRRAARVVARLHARRVRAAVPQLDAGQRAEVVQAIAHDREVADVPVVPDAGREPVGVVGLGVDRAVLRAAGPPAALRLDPAVIGLEAGLLGARADAVGDLVEAVLERLRADLDRLEQDVVLGIPRHASPLSSRPARTGPIRPSGNLARPAGPVHRLRATRAGRVRPHLATHFRRMRACNGLSPLAADRTTPNTSRPARRSCASRSSSCGSVARPSPPRASAVG
jgi:hypothetical protein